ncbi:hypothetical protein OAL54_07580 [Gammaproteobacteria bacterium]|nr:hypothetical protein [Gammaproteobacteria bacterium]
MLKPIKIILFSWVILLLTSSIYATEIDEDFILQEFQRAQSSPDHSVSFVVNASAEFVFNFLSRRVNRYVSDATGVEFEHSNSDTRGQLGSGSERITTLVNSEKLVQRFLQFDPPNNYAYFTDMEKSTLEAPLDYSIARYELSSITNEVTNLKISVVYRSSSRLLGFFVRRAFVSALEKDFEKAVEIMEIEFR